MIGQTISHYRIVEKIVAHRARQKFTPRRNSFTRPAASLWDTGGTLKHNQPQLEPTAPSKTTVNQRIE